MGQSERDAYQSVITAKRLFVVLSKLQTLTKVVTKQWQTPVANTADTNLCTIPGAQSCTFCPMQIQWKSTRSEDCSLLLAQNSVLVGSWLEEKHEGQSWRPQHRMPSTVAPVAGVLVSKPRSLRCTKTFPVTCAPKQNIAAAEIHCGEPALPSSPLAVGGAPGPARSCCPCSR